MSEWVSDWVSVCVYVEAIHETMYNFTPKTRLATNETLTLNPNP